MSGRSEARAPGRTVPGSGVAATRTIAARNAPRSSHHTRVGADRTGPARWYPTRPGPGPRCPVARHQRCQAPGWPQIQQRAADRAGRQAHRYPLQRPGGEQRPDPGGQQEHDARGRIHGKSGDDHRPASHMVRQGAEDQHRHQEEQHVDGEHGGERGCREPPPGLVDAIQRGGRGGGGEEQDQHCGLQPERGRSGRPWPPDSLCPGPR